MHADALCEPRLPAPLLSEEGLQWGACVHGTDCTPAPRPLSTRLATGRHAGVATDFPTTVKQLAAERGVSVASISFEAYDRNTKGTNPDTMKSVMAGRRAPTPVLMEAIARVLGVDPDVFAEYRLAVARQQLDERVVGLDQALANLERLVPPSTPSVRRRAAKAAQRLDDTPPTSRRTRRAAGGEDADR